MTGGVVKRLRIGVLGLLVVALLGAETAPEAYKAEIEKWQPVIRKAGVYAD